MSNQHRRARVAKACESCGADFFQRVERPGKYCSRPCAATAARALGKFKGEKNPRWLGGVAKDGYRYTKRFKAKSPEKVRAHKAVYYAKKTGKLVPWQDKFFDALDACGYRIDREAYWASKEMKRGRR